MTIGVTIAFCM